MISRIDKYEKFYSEIENIKAKNIVISESNEIIYSALSKMKEEKEKGKSNPPLCTF